jgi:MFS family permease
VYGGLCFSRAVQGVCGGLILSGGLALIAGCHADDERGTAVGKAFTGLAAGAIAPLFAGWLAEAGAGPALVFYLLVVVTIGTLLGSLRLRVSGDAHTPLPGAALRASNSGTPLVGTSASNLAQQQARWSDASLASKRSDAPAAASVRPLWREGAALGVAGALVAVNLAAALTEPLVPLFLTDEPLRLSEGKQGAVFASATLAYLACTPVAGAIADAPAKRLRCLVAGVSSAAAGLVLLGLAPFAATGGWAATPAGGALPVTVFGLMLTGAGVALVDTPAVPMLSAIADARGDGNIAAAATLEGAAISVGQALGPLLAAPLVAALRGHHSSVVADGLAPAAWTAAAICALQVGATVRLVGRGAAAVKVTE